MKISLSNKGFNEKPQSKDISTLYFNVQDVTPTEFANYIGKGYCYCNVFHQDVISIKDKKKENFRYSNVISVDIDHTSLSMDEALRMVKTTPTIAYETYSNGKDGLYSYRFVFALTESVWISKIEAVINYFYSKMEEELNITTDKRTKNPYQYFNGTFNKRVICDEAIAYNPTELDLKAVEAPLEHSNTPSGIVIPKIEKRALNSVYESEFIRDFFGMNKRDLISKYNTQFINKEHSDLPTADEDTPLIYFPSDFREIRRFWYQQTDNEKTTTHIRRIKDGEGRRYKLFINGIIRRLIEPSISLDNILYNLVWETYHYINNRDKAITNQILLGIAKNVMAADLNKYNEIGRSKRKYMANPLYCIKYGKSKNTVAKMKIDYDAVGELYDCSLTDKQNVEVMKEYGIEIKAESLRKWKKKNNIKSSIDYSIVDEVIEMGLSERKSVALLKEKGIKISCSQFRRHKSSVHLMVHQNGIEIHTKKNNSIMHLNTKMVHLMTQSVHLTNKRCDIEIHTKKNNSIINLNDTPMTQSEHLNDTETNNDYNIQKTMRQTRTKKINYQIVDEALTLGLSVRKTIDYCANKGVHLSIGALQKYKDSLSEHPNDTVEETKVNTLLSEHLNTKMVQSEHPKVNTLLSEQSKVNTLLSEHLNTKMVQSEHPKVNTLLSEQSKVNTPTATIEVEYNGTILKAYEKRHRTYKVDGLSDFPLYMVLGREELKDYQFLDCDQLIKIGISPTLIYNWNEGCCLPRLYKVA